MTLYQLEVFALVAKSQSFTKAGKELHVGQPSISALMTGLQKELGVKLFERLGVKNQLTDAGKRFFQKTQNILALIQDAKEEMDEVKGLKKGKLRVGGSPLAAASFLPMVVQTFKKDYPGIEVVLTFQTHDNLETMLLDGELDFAIMNRTPHSPLLSSEPYREEEIVVIAPPKHPLAKKKAVPLKLLAKEPWIVYTKGTAVRDMLESKFFKMGLSLTPALEVEVQVGARDAIKSAVAGGMGIGVLSKWHVSSDVKAKRLKLLKVPGLGLKQPLYLIFHKTRQGSALIQAFADFLRRHSKRR